MWDVTVSDTLAKSYVSGTAKEAGFAANKAEARKRTKYQAVPDGYTFIPLAFETLGAWGDTTEEFIRDLCTRLKESTGDPRAGTFFLQRLSLQIVRGNAASVMAEMNAEDVLLLENIPLEIAG
jgi:hypothetical protein